MITVTMIPILDDNYSYLIETSCGICAVLDPALSEPIIEVLEQKNITPTHILNTHHHWDHTDGNTGLQAHYGLKIAAPTNEKSSFDHIDIFLNDGDNFTLGSETAQIIETPGHTRGGICFYFKDSKIIFVGDTLFSLGCGRLLEGTAQDMFTSFEKLKALPDDTIVYCGHEYTKGNAGFCLHQDRNNADLKIRIKEVKELRANGKPTIPTTIGLERKTNIFMKAKSAEEFAALRKLKDQF